MCATASVWVFESKAYRSEFSPSPIWLPGIILWLSGPVASRLCTEPSFQVASTSPYLCCFYWMGEKLNSYCQFSQFKRILPGRRKLLEVVKKFTALIMMVVSYTVNGCMFVSKYIRLYISLSYMLLYMTGVYAVYVTYVTIVFYMSISL